MDARARPISLRQSVAPISCLQPGRRASRTRPNEVRQRSRWTSGEHNVGLSTLIRFSLLPRPRLRSITPYGMRFFSFERTYAFILIVLPRDVSKGVVVRDSARDTAVEDIARSSRLP